MDWVLHVSSCKAVMVNCNCKFKVIPVHKFFNGNSNPDGNSPYHHQPPSDEEFCLLFPAQQFHQVHSLLDHQSVHPHLTPPRSPTVHCQCHSSRCRRQHWRRSAVQRCRVYHRPRPDAAPCCHLSPACQHRPNTIITQPHQFTHSVQWKYNKPDRVTAVYQSQR